MSKTEVLDHIVETLAWGTFSMCTDAPVTGTVGLVPLVLAETVSLRPLSLFNGNQNAAIEKIAEVLDKARDKLNSRRPLDSDDLATQHRIALGHQAVYRYVADFLAGAWQLAQVADLDIEITTRLVPIAQVGASRRHAVLAIRAARPARRQRAA